MNVENDGLERILASLGKNFDLEFEPLDLDGRHLEVLNIANMPAYLERLAASRQIEQPLRDLPLWAKVWPGALVLGRFLRKLEPEGKSLLELGAGMGVCSLVASAYGFRRIVLSEANPLALDFARANVLKNGLEKRIQCTLLEIGKPSAALADEKFDLIAASELLYLNDLHRPLLKFLHQRLASGGKALFCTDRARLKPEFHKLAEREFSVQEGNIGVKSVSDGQTSRQVFNILILERQ